MIRMRGGAFTCSPEERLAMIHSIHEARDAGAHGVVVGALTPSGEVDSNATAEFVTAAGELPVTFHKAFDETPDLPTSLEILIALGIRRVLTSGGCRTAWEGRATLADLVRRAEGRITVMAGGAIDETHAVELIEGARVAEIHLRATADREERFRRVVEHIRRERQAGRLPLPGPGQPATSTTTAVP